MSNTIPLPATPYVLAIAGDGYSDDHCTSFPAWDDGAMYDHAAAVSAAKDAEIAQLRQYLDTAQRRAAALGDEVAGLRNQLHLAEVVRASQVKGLNQGAAGWRERASQLEAEVAGLREALHSIAWSRPLGRTSKMVEALEKKALAALAARKGAT